MARGWLVELNAGVGELDSACVQEGLFCFGESEPGPCHPFFRDCESGLQSAQVGARVSPEALGFCDCQLQGLRVAPAMSTGLSRSRSKDRRQGGPRAAHSDLLC
jgi:hypothetical protein